MKKLPPLQFSPSSTNQACVFCLASSPVQGQGHWTSGERDEQGTTRPTPHQHPRVGQAGPPETNWQGHLATNRFEQRSRDPCLHTRCPYTTVRFPTEQNRGTDIDGQRDSDQTSCMEMKLTMRPDLTTKPTLFCTEPASQILASLGISCPNAPQAWLLHRMHTTPATR